MEHLELQGGPVSLAQAFGPTEVRGAVEGLLDRFAAQLPPVHQPILLKPDLSTDRSGLTGASTDLRVLVALIEALKDRGYRRLSLGSAPPPAFYQAGVDPLRRLRVDRAAARFGVQCLELSRGPFEWVALDGQKVQVSRAVLEAAIFPVGTVRTHPVVGLAMQTYGLLGLVHSPHQARLQRRLGPALLALARRFPTPLGLLGALVVMEGEGPREGTPVRFERLLAGPSVLTVDLVAARLLGHAVEEVMPLWLAIRQGALAVEAQIAVESRLAVVQDLRRPALRGPARHTGDQALGWLKQQLLARGELPGWRVLSRWAGLRRLPDPRPDPAIGWVKGPGCTDTCRQCEAFCPTGLRREELGLDPAHPRCIECLYCLQVCGREGLTVAGESGPMLDQCRLEVPLLHDV